MTEETNGSSSVACEQARRETKRISAYKIKTWLGVVPGLLLQMLCAWCMIFDVPPPFTLVWYLVLLVGTVLVVWGCHNYAKDIGNHGAWGLLGIASFIGVLALSKFPDLTKIDPTDRQYSRQSCERNALLGTIGGLVIQLWPLLELFPTSFTFSWYLLLLTGICLFVWGCCNLAKFKGYDPIWGLLGLAGLMGALVLSMFPQTEGIESESDELSYLQKQAKTGLSVAIASPFIAFMAGLQIRGLGAPHSAAQFIFWICLLTCYILSIWGCACLLKRKGYKSRMWVVLSLLTIPGWLLILILPDRKKTVNPGLHESLRFFQREMVTVLAVLAIFVGITAMMFIPMYASYKRVACDRAASINADELAKALQKLSSQVKEFQCESQPLPSDFLEFLIGPYYGWKGTDTKREVLIRIEGDSVYACTRKGSHPEGDNKRYIYGVNFKTGENLPPIIGPCQGKMYGSKGTKCYSESILNKDCSFRKPNGKPCE